MFLLSGAGKKCHRKALMFNYNFCHFPQFIVCNVFIDELRDGGWGGGHLLHGYFWFKTDWLWINKFAILQSNHWAAKQHFFLILSVFVIGFFKKFQPELGYSTEMICTGTEIEHIFCSECRWIKEIKWLRL